MRILTSIWMVIIVAAVLLGVRIDNRKIRLAKGQNIFRYYWLLWLLSPVILFGLLLVIAFTTGVLEGWKELG